MEEKWSKRTGYKMAKDRQVGYRGKKFDKKCFQRQLKEIRDDGRPRMTLEELKSGEAREVSFQEAQDFIIKYEWLGHMGVTKFSYGWYVNDELVCLFCFGLTAGTNVLSEPFGEEHKHEGIVLVRGANVPHAHPHTASYCMGKVLPYVRQRGYKFVIAYSDLEAGEIGTVYQATNWYFFGLTNALTYLVRPDGKRVDMKIVHKYAKKHGITRQEQLQRFFDEGYTLEKASPKLKYIKLIGNKRENRELMAKRRFEIYPYLKRKDNMEEVLDDAKRVIRKRKNKKAEREYEQNKEHS